MHYSDTLVLYRGDFQKIKEFDFHKTDKYCLVGPGIYLTTDPKVAHSYRHKGCNVYTRKVTILDGRYNTKGEFYKALEKEYCEYMYRQERGLNPLLKLNAEQSSAACVKYRDKFLTEQFEGFPGFNIKMETAGSFVPEKYHFSVTSKSDGEQPIGFLTEFHFDKKYFLSNILNVESRIDTSTGEILKEAFGADAFFATRDALTSSSIPYVGNRGLDFTVVNFVKNFVSPSAANKVVQKKKRNFVFPRPEIWATLIRHLSKEYGVIGFKYQGSLRTNSKLHSAFSIWDDEYVNAHKVKRHR